MMKRKTGIFVLALGALALTTLVTPPVVSAQPAAAASGSAMASPAPGPDAAVASSPTDAGAASSDPDAGTAPSDPDASVFSPAVPTARRTAPIPPPSSAQVAALGMLKEEVDAYEKGARDYRDTVTTIIRLHYEAKKREILSDLDREIALEKAELKKARDIAIQRFEEFIATYSGPRANPEATPDAMYRLAALYEERARSEEATDPIEVGLKPAIALYKRVVVEFPKYREIAGIYYFLGHALNDSSRIPEAQQVWRSLVCHNHYAYPTSPDPKDATRDVVKPIPQDHDEAFWTGWRGRWRDSRQIKKGNPETTYEEVYPEDCRPLAQTSLRPGEDPKYVAEVWWQIGNWEFDQLDFGSGVTREDPGSVWGYNRAASAYTRAMGYRKPPLYGVALYKYAWTLFKQQRYEAATSEFIRLLLYTDDEQKRTGDPGADFRSEAYIYIADSLTNVDFKGPEPWEPYIMRPDILDTEPNPEKAEKKLHIAIDRVKDPRIVPQDKPWTIDVYRALALNFRSLNQFSNAVETYETMLQQWPMDPTAPETQNAIAETYDQLNFTKRPGTPEHDLLSQKSLEARTKLAGYIGNTPWVDANKDNPAAIQNAERLVRGGLRQAAAQHTNNGKAALVAASETGDSNRQVELLARAASEYRLAGIGWYGYLKQDENSPDAYESRYWLADAKRQHVRIQVVLHKLAPKSHPEPAKKDVDEAFAAALAVRDSNEDDKYLDNAAFFVVDVADVGRDLAYQRFEETKGAAGVQRRDEVKFDSEDLAVRKIVRDPLPAVVQQAVAARDEYVRVVPPNLDTGKHGIEYQFYAAEQFFLYGQFDVARARFEPMWKERCGKDEFGYKAWEKLITMSNLERDADRSTELAKAEKEHSCAVNAEQGAKAGLIVNPTLQEAAYVNARRKFEEAKKAPAGPDKQKLWREAAGLYEAALQAAPGRDEAPEAAMNAAYAYKQVGEYNKAIELYNKFISEYGSEDRLSKLQKGDPKAKTAPDPKRYQERVGYLGDAYDALATTYYSFFNYQRAAETNEKIAANERFEEKKRRDAAKNAMILYSNIGQRDKMLAEYRLLSALHPTPEDKAAGEYLVASYDYKQWDAKGSTGGSNGQVRAQAEFILSAYYDNHKRDPNAGKFMVEAAYFVSKMKRSTGDSQYRYWYRQTMAAWEAYARGGGNAANGRPNAQQPPYVDYAAEAEFTLLDEEITAKFDPADKHKYTGAVDDVLGESDPSGKLVKKGKYQKNAEEADKWDRQLDALAKKYESLEWVPAAFARKGAVYDTLRSGLYFTTTAKGGVKLFTPKQETMLNTMRNSGRDELMNKADELEDAKKEFWRKKKELEIAGADEAMARNYAIAVTLGRKYNVRSPQVSRAVSRLAYYTDIIGDAKLGAYVSNAPDPINKNGKLSYAPGMYVQTRPGLTALPPSNGESKPQPAAP